MEMFPKNKIVAITDLILINMDLVQYILHLCTPGVIVLTTPEINLPVVNMVVDMVVDILMDTVVVDDWGKGHIIPAMGVLDVDITLLKLLLLFLFFTSNRLLPRMFHLMPFQQ